jgi:hypothetical protein
MPVSSRWAVAAVWLTALGFFAVGSSRPTPVVWAADPSGGSPGVTVYDPNPKHLWNRLHEALYVRLDGEGPDDPGELDPFLWQRSPYQEKGERYNRAVAVLDEFIAERGDKLIADPRKRALLQRDLWVLFDTVAPSRFLVAPDQRDGEIELAGRVAKVLPRLALTADQIKALPDNFAEAVAARKFPDWFDAGRLWDADGPWVLLSSEEKVPLARTHVEFFGGRPAFFVFLRLPDGRDQARKYLADLRSHGTDAKLPAGGAYFALVRQMQLIDDRGRITLTPVIESLQIRGLGNHEFKLSRKDFTAGNPSLAAVGPEDRERDYLTFLGRNAGGGRSKVLNTCGSCHGADTMQSFLRQLPPAQSIRPTLTASNRDEEALRLRIWKKDRYEWGLLQGLTLTPSKE